MRKGGLLFLKGVVLLIVSPVIAAVLAVLILLFLKQIGVFGLEF